MGDWKGVDTLGVELSVETTDRVRARSMGSFMGSSWITGTGTLCVFSRDNL